MVRNECQKREKNLGLEKQQKQKQKSSEKCTKLEANLALKLPQCEECFLGQATASRCHGHDECRDSES